MTLEEITKELAELDQQAKSVAARKSELLDEASVTLSEQGADSYKGEVGTVYKTVRKSWKYSEELERLAKETAEQVKAKQSEEQESGKAVAEEKESWGFRGK